MAVITCDNNLNNLVGSAADDQITGLGGNDFYDAGEGDDRIIFRAALMANDTIVGELEHDTLVLSGTLPSKVSQKMVDLTRGTSWNDNFSQMGPQVSRANFQLTNAGIFYGAIDVPGGVTVNTVLSWDIDTLMLSNRRSYNGLQPDTYWANGAFQTLKSRSDQDVFAYVNVGKVDKNLDNYEIAGASDPWFGGATSVANINFANFWDPSWFARIKTEVDHAIRAGADGIVFDEIDVYYELRDVAGRTLRDNARDMAKLVSDLAVYARQASSGGSEFRIMVNGASYIINDSVSFNEGLNQSNPSIISTFVDSIDAMIFENPFDGELEESNILLHLRQQYGDIGKQVVIVDSMKNVGLQDVDRPDRLIYSASRNGFIPFHANAGTAGGPVLDYLTAPRISGLNSNRSSGGSDVLTGTPIADLLDGGAGNDLLVGQAGNDTLLGGPNNDYLGGDAGNDSLDGGDGVDYLEGNDGADMLSGGQGDDQLVGDDGADTLSGGQGDDELVGGYGNDILFGGLGSDTMWAASGNDTLLGGPNTDYLSGGGGNDSLDGEDGVDYLEGDDGADTLLGGQGDDQLVGGDGNDILFGGLGIDTLVGRDGFDFASYSNATSGLTLFMGGGTFNSGEANGDVHTSIEGLIGSAFDDIIGGLADNNELRGLNGNDFIYGRAGVDTLLGGDGNDVLDGGLDGDVLRGEAGIDVAYYRDATATVTASLLTGGVSGEAAGDTYFDIENIWGSRFGDVLTGDNNGGQVYGFEGNDTLSGLGGDDFFYGGEGFDTLTGGTGVDNFFFLSWNDHFNQYGTLEPYEGGDTFTDFTSGTDRIILSRYWFGFGNIGGPAAALTETHANFVTNGVAATSRPTLIWNQTNRTLSFDADGNGATQAVLLGTFQQGATLTLGDIWTA